MSNMKQWTKKDYCRMLEKNGYFYDRKGKGSHSIYTNSSGSHITVGKTINPCIARRIIKENKLSIIFFIYGTAIRFYIKEKRQ